MGVLCLVAWCVAQAPDQGSTVDFFLFPRLKSNIKGARFADVAAIQERVTAVLRSIPKEAFADYERCQQCVVKDDDYFEGQKLICLYLLFCSFSGTIHRTFWTHHVKALLYNDLKLNALTVTLSDEVAIIRKSFSSRCGTVGHMFLPLPICHAINVTVDTQQQLL
jgi:hypothetical protein